MLAVENTQCVADVLPLVGGVVTVLVFSVEYLLSLSASLAGAATAVLAATAFGAAAFAAGAAVQCTANETAGLSIRLST
jgi:hypothetical protein